MKHNEFDASEIPDYSSIPGTTRREKLVERLKLCLIIGILYPVLSIFSFGCPIRSITGIPCPGCGMTRAIRYALQLDFVSAWHYHPLFFLIPLMILVFLFESYIPKKIVRSFWGCIIVLFLLTYLLRLFL
jgi:hypothetical protein